MIKREQLVVGTSYVLVGAVSILFAMWVSSALLEPASTQEEFSAPAVDTQQEGVSPEPSQGEVGEFPSDPALGDPALAEPAPTGSEALQKEQLRTEVQSFLEPFIYDPKGRRDPFRPYTEVLIGGDSGGPVGPLLPLQRFDLDQLKLIGIIWDVRDPKAMFLDPNSRIYTVGRDERIGPNNGYIAAIREGEVVVVETFRQRGGEAIYTPRVIRMER